MRGVIQQCVAWLSRPGSAWFAVGAALFALSIGAGAWGHAVLAGDASPPDVGELHRQLEHIYRIQGWTALFQTSSYAAFAIGAVRAYGYRHRLSGWTCAGCGADLRANPGRCHACGADAEMPKLSNTLRRWAARLSHPHRRAFAVSGALLAFALVLNTSSAEVLRRSAMADSPLDASFFKSVNVIAGAAIAGALALLGVGTARRTRRQERLKAGMCAECGYDLCASPGRCPECGTVTGDLPEKIEI